MFGFFFCLFFIFFLTSFSGYGRLELHSITLKIKNNMKQTIIVFTRHDLTQEQIDAAWKIAAEKKGANLADPKDCQVIYLKELASVNIETEEQLEEVAYRIYGTFISGLNTDPKNRMSVLGIFGVFPAMLLEKLEETEMFHYTNFFSAWNQARTQEGGKPTFEFKRWCKLPLRVG